VGITPTTTTTFDGFYTVKATDGTAWTSPTLHYAQIEATMHNMAEAKIANPGKTVTFAGFNRSVCLSGGTKYNHSRGHLTWDANGTATSNCRYNPKTPSTI
jgi:hypothetical protein